MQTQLSKTGGRFDRYADLILPVVLLLTGLILIGGDRVGFLSLDQIQNLWPFALILVGLSDLLSSTTPAEEPAPHRGAKRV